MTSGKCFEQKLTFAAVHDSYWTHACDVDKMNKILREEFINLYEQPILENLSKDLKLRFPCTEFPALPERGELDIKKVIDSKYFFA